MLPKKKRVTKGVFQVLLKEGKIFSTQLFLFYFIKGESPQYAVVAPKNIFKSAVKRNKYKRIGYNILRSFHIKPGTGVFMYKKQAILATNQDIKENINAVLNKFNLI